MRKNRIKRYYKGRYIKQSHFAIKTKKHRGEVHFVHGAHAIVYPKPFGWSLLSVAPMLLRLLQR